MEAYYHTRFVDFVKDVVKELGRLLWYDQVTEVPGMLPVKGTEFQVDDTWHGGLQEGARQGEFPDYEIDILPTSMEYRSPRERLRDLDETWDRMMGIAPLAMQMGMMPNIQEYLRLRAKYTSTPEMESLFIMNQVPPEEQQQQRQGGRPGQGEYIHHSRPSGMGNSQQNDQAMMQMMASQNNNRNTM
jgi:hypothetical protein